MEDQLRVLVTLGFTLLLVMLRLEARTFGAAEYAQPDAFGRMPSRARRLAWYLVGLLLLLGATLVHPSPGTGLLLRMGNAGEAVALGLVFAVVGALQAGAAVWLRDREFRLLPAMGYPGALMSAVGDAFIDEAAFRGLLFAYLLGAGIDPVASNLLQAVVYALATRLGGSGGDRYGLGVALVTGLFGGWLTIITGGIGAAVFGHAASRLAQLALSGGSSRAEYETAREARSWAAVLRGRVRGAGDAGPRP
jgi:hypothetical protein